MTSTVAPDVGGVIRALGGDTIEVLAAYGLAEGVVNRAVGFDRYLLDATTLDVIKREIGRKAFAYVRDEALGRSVRLAVDADLQDRSALDFVQLRAVGEAFLAGDARRDALRWAIGQDGRLMIA